LVQTRCVRISMWKLRQRPVPDVDVAARKITTKKWKNFRSWGKSAS
jgi:hypothetical protein